MRIFAACIFTETNTFSPIPTGLNDFNVVRPQDAQRPDAEHLLSMLQQLGKDRGDQIIYGISACAQPSGITVRAVFERLRDELLRDLNAAGPVDVVFLLLHGAMVAESYDDCEGDIIARVRDLVGPDVVVVVELDLHCHLSEQMIAPADIVLTYKEYPHVDVNDRAIELYELAIQCRVGKVRPTMALFDCKMVGIYSTYTPLMRGFVDKMIDEEKRDDVLSVSFGHGFPWGDVPDAGGKMLVVTNNNPQLAVDLAQDLGMQVFALRHEIGFDSLPLEEALTQAVASDKTPVVVADQSDNAGGGAPSDSTFALRWLLDHKVEDVGIAFFYDPGVVRIAKAAGVGAKLTLRLGGKLGPTSGDPLDLSVRVLGIKDELYHLLPQVHGQGMPFPLGDTVAVRCRGIDIIVSSERSQCFAPSIFEEFGIDPAKKRILIPKSMNHFLAAFEPIAGKVIYMAAPGAVVPTVQKIDYQHMQTSNKYPWVKNPHG